MSNSFPGMNVIGVKYTIDVPGHTIGLASTIASTIELVEYKFTSAADYDSFDQAAAETTIKSALGTVATSWGSLLGVDPSLISAGLVISRTWTFAGPDWVTCQVLYGDRLAYP